MAAEQPGHGPDRPAPRSRGGADAVARDPGPAAQPGAAKGQAARPDRAPGSRPRRPPRQPRAPRPPRSTEPSVGPLTHLIIGKIVSAVGLRGEVRVTVDTDFPERFEALNTVLVGDDLVPMTVERGRLQDRTAVLKFKGVDDRTAAEGLRGRLIQIPIEEAAPLPEGVWYWHQLLGLDVWTAAGEHVGTLHEIIETGGNDVYVVKRDGREFLIPAIESVIQSVDLDARRMTIEPLPGMLD